MGFVVAIILFAIAIYTFIRKRNIAHPCFLICLGWGAISLLGAFRFFGLYDIRTKTWFIILTGVLSFVVGGFLSGLGKQREENHEIPLKKQELYLWSERTHLILFFVVIALQLVPAISSLRLLFSGVALGDIRAAYYGYQHFDGYIRTLIPGPIGTCIEYAQDLITTLLQAICILAFMEKKKVKYLLECFAVILFPILINGGRYIIIFTVIDLIVCLLCLKKVAKKGEFQMSAKLKAIIFAVMGVAIVGVAAITLLRGSAVSQVLESFYTYMCGNLVLSDMHLARIEGTDLQLGIVSYFYGGIVLLSPILSLLGMRPPQWYYMANTFVMKGQDWLTISDNGIGANAMLTAYYYLYADFRWVGVVIGMLLFGFFMGKLYNAFIKTGKLYFLVFYAASCRMIFTTIQNYALISAENVLLVLFIVVFCACEWYKDNYYIRMGNYGEKTHHLRRYWRRQTRMEMDIKTLVSEWIKEIKN